VKMSPVAIWITVFLFFFILIMLGPIGMFIAAIVVFSGIAGWVWQDKRMEQEYREDHDNYISQLEEENKRLREEQWRNKR
jgi:chromate transport protein ChrA